MFAENFKVNRKAKGMSQNEIAIRLNVVRQTISKWEKSLSIPDAHMLIKISEIFEISVSELLGEKIEKEDNSCETDKPLSRKNEQLIVKNRRGKIILNVILGIIIGIITVNILLVIVGLLPLNGYEDDENIKTRIQSEIVSPSLT